MTKFQPRRFITNFVDGTAEFHDDDTPPAEEYLPLEEHLEREVELLGHIVDLELQVCRLKRRLADSSDECIGPGPKCRQEKKHDCLFLKETAENFNNETGVKVEAQDECTLCDGRGFIDQGACISCYEKARTQQVPANCRPHKWKPMEYTLGDICEDCGITRAADSTKAHPSKDPTRLRCDCTGICVCL